MTPVRNGTTRNSKNIYSELKDMIQFLDLKPGQAISESQLCASLGVSRTPVREALIRLADEKLVCFFPRSGTYVTRIDLDYIKELGLMRKSESDRRVPGNHVSSKAGHGEKKYARKHPAQ